MAKRFPTPAIAVLLIVWPATMALAQGRTGSSAGGTGASSFGASTGGRTGSTGTGTGTFGARSLGGTTGVPNASRSFRGTQQPGQGVDASAGQLSGNERFLRQNRQAGSFVGGDTRDIVNFLSQSTGRSGQTSVSGLRSGQNGNSNRNRQNGDGGYGLDGGGMYGRSNQRMLRPTLRVEFTHPAPAVASVQSTLTQRLNRSAGPLRVADPVQVQVEERTAVLRGEVATDHDRDLAERLALLEPGISSVRNELTIALPKGPAASAARGDLPPPAQAP